MNTKDFILRCKQIYGNKYDYSKTIYENNNNKVLIKCNDCGTWFWQTPHNHLKSHGCPVCGRRNSSEKRKRSLRDFIEKANKIHNGKYDYSKVVYVNNNTKVCIICPYHGEFWQTPHSHLSGGGCSECYNERRGKKRRETAAKEFIEKARKIHGDKYDYSKVKYINNSSKVCIICPEHGEFWQTPAHHLSGEGCPKCGYDLLSENQVSNKNEFIEKARKIHGDKYDYSKFIYVNSKTKGIIICPKHGEFEMTPNSHLRKAGCPKCATESIKEKISLTKDEFIERARQVHNNKYDYSKVNYINNKTPVCIICPDHGEFWQKPNFHLIGHGCPKCSHHISQWESEIYHFLTDNGIRCEESNRSILKNQEIDIYLPDYGIGIECDGLHWHSEKFHDKNYHLHKTVLAHMNGIRLIHIFEDEWVYRQDILKSMLMNMLGKTNHKIYARKCQIMEVNGSERKAFLNGNHVQGDCISSVNLGLYYKGDLVSLMTFGKPRINVGSGVQEDGSWELIRFCSKLNTDVIGAASKLFKYFLKTYNPVKVTTYSDKRWSLGRMYEILGFSHDHDSSPNYFYIVGNHRENRFRYRKSVLVKEGYDSNKTEHEIMMEREIYRIYDCGTKVWIWGN